MGALRCVDGSVLSVEAVTCRDRIGQPYEITLKLARDSVPFAAVGQRCGYQLSDLAARVSAARQDPEQAAAWPDPDDRFPPPEPGAPTWPDQGQGHRPAGTHPDRADHAVGVLPGDHEYFALRSHERFDLPATGELRCVLRSTAIWVGECVGVGAHAKAGRGRHVGHAVPGQHGLPGQRSVPGPRAAAPLSAGETPEQSSHRTWRHRPGGQGQWQLTRRAVIEAWGAGGVGVRAVLTSAELVAFLDTVLNGPDGAVATGEIPIDSPQAGGHLPDRSRVP